MSPETILRSLLLFFALALAADAQFSPKEFYVPARQYRFCKEGGNQPKPGQHRLEAVEDHGAYQMAFLEEKEDGTEWDSCQFAATKQLIERKRRESGGPITVLVYVHGWKNQANEVYPGQPPQDVEKFRYFVQRWAEEYEERGRWPVVGVYVGWHGRSLNAPGWISFLTFWTRSIGARRAGADWLKPGQTGLDDRLDQLIQLTTARGDSEGEFRPKILFLGHSFGARVLETAVAGHRRSYFNGACKQLQTQNVGSKVDGVFFLNAATSSAFMRRQLGACQPGPNFMLRAPDFDAAFCADSAHRLDRRCQPYPLLVSVSAKMDWTTRYILLLASLQHPFAFLPWNQSHVVEPFKAPDDENDVFRFPTVRGERRQEYVVKRKPGSKHGARNPIWAMTVDRVVAADHGDIWNEDMFSFIRGLIAASDVREQSKTKNFKQMR